MVRIRGDKTKAKGFRRRRGYGATGKAEVKTGRFAVTGCKWPELQCQILKHKPERFTASRCNWLQLAATGCNWLQLAATGCNRLQLAATGCNWLQPAATGCNRLQLAATAATGCNWLQLGGTGYVKCEEAGWRARCTEKVHRARPGSLMRRWIRRRQALARLAGPSSRLKTAKCQRAMGARAPQT
jgi:hypothetical protein